jgi:hypothetical protein
MLLYVFKYLRNTAIDSVRWQIIVFDLDVFPIIIFQNFAEKETLRCLLAEILYLVFEKSTRRSKCIILLLNFSFIKKKIHNGEVYFICYKGESLKFADIST